MNDLLWAPLGQTNVTLDDALEAINDRSLDVSDRGAIFGVLHAMQLKINRALRPAKEDLLSYMQRHDVKRLGPLSLSSTAVDPHYVCNDPGNWSDASVQDRLAEWRQDKRFGPYIRHIPEHLEVDTRALAQGFADSDPAAGELKRACDAEGFRVERDRRLSIKVDEARPERNAA